MVLGLAIGLCGCRLATSSGRELQEFNAAGPIEPSVDMDKLAGVEERFWREFLLNFKLSREKKLEKSEKPGHKTGVTPGTESSP